MATLTGKTIANTYKDLLQVSNNNSGVDTTMRTVSDGEGTNTALELSNAGVNINGTFQLNGESITVNASAINNMADIGSATGIIAVNSGNVYGRTLTAGTPVSITNANGAAGNPTITLASIANVSGSYGPFTNFGVNDYGQIVSATAVSTSVSIPTVRATELIAETLTLSSNASIVGNLNVDGTFIVDGIVSAASDVAVSGSLYVTSNISVTGNTNTSFLQAVSASIADLTVNTINFELVSVSALTANTITAVSAVNITTGSAGSVTASTDADELVLESSSNTGMSVLAPASGNAQIYFGEGTDNDAAFIQYNGSLDDLILSTTNSGSQIIFKTDTGTAALTLDNSQNATFAGTLTATTGVGTPSARIHALQGADTIIKSESVNADSIAQFVVKNDAREYSLQVRGNLSDAFVIRDNVGVDRIILDTSGDTTFAGNIKYSGTTFNFNSTTSDASDNARAFFTGGGGASASRGSFVGVYGNENAVAGQLLLVAGTGSDGHINFQTGGGETMRLTGDMLLIGKSSTTITSNALQASLQIMGNAYNNSSISAMRWGANANGATLNLGKSRNATVGSNTVVSNGDELGRIDFSGDDGTDFQTLAGRISSVVNGTPGTGDIPADLVFSPGDGGSVTETLRLLSNTNASFANWLGVGVNPPARALHVKGGTDTRTRTEESGGTLVDITVTNSGHYIDSSGTGALTINKIGSAAMHFKTANASAMTITASQNVHIGGTTEPGNLTRLEVTNSGDTSTIGTGTLALNNTNTTAGAGSAILFSSVEDTGANRRGVIEVISEGTQGGAMKFSTRDSVGVGSAWDEDTLILTGGNATFAGNVAVNTTLPTIAGTTGSLHLGDAGGIVTFDGETSYTNNAYFNSGWKFRTADTASMLQLGNSDVPLRVSYSASGSADAAITWIEALQITDAGQVKLYHGGNRRLETESYGMSWHGKDTRLPWSSGDSDHYFRMYYDAAYHMGVQFLADARDLVLYNKAADNTGDIRFQTGSTPSERMVILAAGQVGINQSNPQNLLHITDTSSGALTKPIRLHNSATGALTKVGIEFTNSTDATSAPNSAQIYTERTTGGANAIVLAPSNGTTPTEALRLATGGAATFAGDVVVPDEKSLEVTTANLPAIRPSLSLDFARSGAFDPRLTYTRASTGTYYDATSKLQTASSGTARIDHDPATGEALGLLVEAAATNLNIRSEEFDNAAWYKDSSAAITATTGTAPDGTATADTWNGSDYITNASLITVTASTAYTASVFIKAGTATSVKFQLQEVGGYSAVGNLVINPSAGTITVSAGTGSVTSVGNGWYRYAVKATIPTSVTSARLVFTDANGTVLLWGAQLELGDLTSYISTTSASVTRAADIATLTNMSWLDTAEGTILVEASLPVTDATNRRLVEFSNNSDNERILINHGTGSPQTRLQLIAGNVSQAAMDSSVAWTAGVPKTFALGYKKDDFVSYEDGTQVSTDSSGTVPSSLSEVALGQTYNDADSLNGHLHRLAYYPKRLTNTQLQALTE